MSHFAGHKPRSSSYAASRRTAFAAVFAGLTLVCYSMIPRPDFMDPRDNLPHESFEKVNVPGNADAADVREMDTPAVAVVQEVEGVKVEREGEREGEVDEQRLRLGEEKTMLERQDERADTDVTVTHQETQQNPTTFEETPGCLRSIVYDKPVKTGSTAVTFAIREYLRSTKRKDSPCSLQGEYSCAKQVDRMCKGTHRNQSERPSFLGHLKQSDPSNIDCLKRMSYYAVTSIRHPYERRKSAYLYNKTVKGMHYGINYTVPFAEFMSRLPRCVLYNDYDALGQNCDEGGGIEERVKRIVERFDEVIELGEEAHGPLFKKIAKKVERKNESVREEVETFDQSSLKEELVLYEALREKMLKGGSERVPC